MSGRALLRRLVLCAVAVCAAGAGASADDRRAEIQVAWLRLPGQPEPAEPRALSSLLGAVARRTAVAASSDPAPVVGPTDPRLFDHPLVVVSGRGGFPALDDEALDTLSTYLTLGGMVVIDDASGTADSPFASRAREEFSRVLAGREFEPLPSDHALHRSYYLLDRAWGRVEVDESLSAILLDGRAAVLFSPNDLAGAWARDAMGNWSQPVRPGGLRQREMAIRLGINVVVYALTLDYKADLVHLPLILERRR